MPHGSSANGKSPYIPQAAGAGEACCGAPASKLEVMSTSTPSQPQIPLTAERRERVREMIVDELEAAWLYDELAKLTDPELGETLEEMAESEREHAQHWCDLIDDRRLLDNPPRPGFRRRMLAWQARFGGLQFVISQLRREELVDIRRYQADPDSGSLAEEEREHRATLAQLGAATGGGGSRYDIALGDAEQHSSQNTSATTFRATLFGLNDGVVSNLALVGGVAGVAVGSDAVLVAGIGGWLAGACSMAAGEYISVRSQAELHESQIALERDELELDPEEERRELVGIYVAKGISRPLAEEIATELMANSSTALDTLAREELGLDPDDLGSPGRAAVGSFAAFSLGAIVPVLPFLIAALTDATPGWGTFVASVLASVSLLALGGLLTSVVTSRAPLYAAARMVAIGLLATGLTLLIGSLLPIDL